ncbi:MAG: UDP-N-acetylmuramoyl-tripeptide--D-alanyl-D-alanine ligase [Alphaproteobacteria bacterium]|nr:UDP-N-acetylmuramoyl-tripeptide--D-alanyl-D-alanine ligase [Alphaproteobacteria bacterium]
MNPVLWTRADAAAATGGRAQGAKWTARGVVIDSRRIARGDLFVALPGDRVDGHDYVTAALRAGAVAALVSRVPAGVENAPLLIVEDVLTALADLGRAARARATARIAAITGSVGKTGSKEMLTAALTVLGPTHRSAGNLNNHIGAPLSLARLPADAAFAVFELGMNHANEIRPLARMVRPHVALITNVEPVHAGYFDSVEAIADAKAEILEGLEPGGTAVLNRDNPHFERLRAHAERLGVGRIVTFGSADECDARLLAVGQSGGTTVTAEIAGARHRWSVGGIGRHWAINSLGVAATLHALGVDLDTALPALKGVSALRGRGGQVRLPVADGRFTLIDESYNASPPAVRAALTVFADAPTGPGGQRILVLGDMLELGSSATAAHRGLADAVKAAAPDHVFLVGPEMAALRAALPSALVAGHAERSVDLAGAVAEAVGPGDVVLVKGSLGMAMKAVVEVLETLGTATPKRVVNGR